MKKLKEWLDVDRQIWICKSRKFYIEKVGWFMLTPQITIFLERGYKWQFGAISFGWMFWQLTFGIWEE